MEGNEYLGHNVEWIFYYLLMPVLIEYFKIWNYTCNENSTSFPIVLCFEWCATFQNNTTGATWQSLWRVWILVALHSWHITLMFPNVENSLKDIKFERL